MCNIFYRHIVYGIMHILQYRNWMLQLTFLEFYEIILEATKELFFLKNKSEKLLQTKIEKEIKSVEINNL